MNSVVRVFVRYRSTVAWGLIAAVCYKFALGRWGLWPLLAVPLGVSALLIKSSSPRVFRSMWLLWTVCFFASFAWIEYPVRVYGRVWFPASVVPTVLLAMYCGLFPATAAKIAKLIATRNRVAAMIWFAVLFTAAEIARERLLTGFGWSSPGYAFASDGLLVQAADVLGVYWLTFLSLMIVGLAALSMRGAAAAVLLGLVWVGYGGWRLHDLEHSLAQQQGPTLEVVVAQGNIDQLVKWNRSFREESVRIYQGLTREAIEKVTAQGRQPDLAVWPETAVPMYMQRPSSLRTTIEEEIRATSTALLSGAPAYSFDGNRRRSHNRAYLWDNTGSQLGHVDKSHLVPFGEYVPLQPWLSFINKMVVGVGNFAPGEGDGTLDIKVNDTLWTLAVSICYEIIFSAETRATLEDADVAVVISNDAWFGPTDSPYQQWAMAKMRAVENRVPIVRAGNSGISGWIDIIGNARVQTDIFTRTSASMSIPHYTERTVFQRFGHIWEYGLMGIGLCALGYGIALSRRNRQDRKT